MLKELMGLDPSLEKLQRKNLLVIDNHLVVSGVSYVNDKGVVCSDGLLISAVNIEGVKPIMPPIDHVVHFKGRRPCDSKGIPLNNLVNNEESSDLTPNLRVNYSFSNKPEDGFESYYDKIVHYKNILSQPVVAAKSSICSEAQKELMLKSNYKDTDYFCYSDTHSTRSGTTAINYKTHRQKIAIIGIGGTGSYVLDLVSKNPVAQINIYDADKIENHNAFRAPGAISNDDLSSDKNKADYYGSLYSNMNKRIQSFNRHIDKNNLAELGDRDFVFVCTGNAEFRKATITYLLDKKIPFVDVGIAVEIKNDKLDGAVRVSFRDKGDTDVNDLAGRQNDKDGIYSNIQISELNALNACLAVVRWKQWSGIYIDESQIRNLTYASDDSTICVID